MIKAAARYTKAVVAAVVAGSGAYYVANQDLHVTSAEWQTIAVIAVTALVTTWGSPNKDDNAPTSPMEG